MIYKIQCFLKNIQGFRTTATIWQILYPPVSTEFAESGEGVWVDVHWPAIRRYSKLHKVSRFLQLNFQIFSLSTDTNTTVVNCVHSNSASYILPSMNLSTTTLISILYLPWSEPGDIKNADLQWGKRGCGSEPHQDLDSVPFYLVLDVEAPDQQQCRWVPGLYPGHKTVLSYKLI